MTRINCVPVECLESQHLLAEYKEITRPFNKAYRRLINDNLDFDSPEDYTLNRGHETFFFDKLAWLFCRYVQLKDELLKRGYNIDLVKFNEVSVKLYDQLSSSPLWNWYIPTPEDQYLNMARLVRRSKTIKVKEELNSGL